ncbi:universal stress protein [Enorma phocaeensis]|uniref:Universal stress protein n=1 Tax=Enorma phocaeensis TaxID=1871019 RepID=A0A921LSQ5_9ACTN|nr:universal stress protein [Enorma phocaeensis]HJG37293.1 universal stress protein [Enorma phocaeensis]
MLFKNVLVPYDESEHAKSALHIALGMVGDDSTATVHVLAIVATGAFTSPTLTGNAFDDLSYLSDPDRTESDDIMGALVHRARTDMEGTVDDALDGATCKVVVTAGVASSPVEGIAEYVESHGIDLVVMGRRGLGALRGMLGSVSFGVLRSVDVPVLTVK